MRSQAQKVHDMAHRIQYWPNSVADLRGEALVHGLPLVPISFIVMQFSAKILPQNRGWRHSSGKSWIHHWDYPTIQMWTIFLKTMFDALVNVQRWHQCWTKSRTPSIEFSHNTQLTMLASNLKVLDNTQRMEKNSFFPKIPIQMYIRLLGKNKFFCIYIH